MLAPPPSFPTPLLPPTSTQAMTKPRETSPSTSLDNLYLVSPHSGHRDTGSTSQPGSESGSGSILSASQTTSSTIPSNVFDPNRNLLGSHTQTRTLNPDRSPPFPLTTQPPLASPVKQGQVLRRPKSSVGLESGTNGSSACVGAAGGRGPLTRFHPFAHPHGHGQGHGHGRPRGASGSGSGLGVRPNTGVRDENMENQMRMETETRTGMQLGVGSLLSPDTMIPGVTRPESGYGHTSTFSLHSVGSMDCPSTSGTGTTSEEESICSPGDETPVAGLPLSIIGPNTHEEESSHEDVSGKKAWGETFPRSWGRTLSGSSSSGGSDMGGEGGQGAESSRRRKNARGLRIDVRRTFSVGQQAGVTRQEESVEIPPHGLQGKGIKYATVGRRPMLSISLDPLSPAKQARQPSHARSLFPLPRSNHVNPEGHVRPPYADGPVQVVKGVWIGNEESVERFDKWVGGANRGMIVNVAKELEDPYKGPEQEEMGRVDVASVARSYAATKARPVLTYLKLDWTHGETDLASETPQEQTSRPWGFRKTIERMEQARTAGIPILIHCQCGISRSATLIIAYVLWLSHHGLVDEDGLKQTASMWHVNDYVKGKSEWVGPNVSLICQLLEWEKVLRQQDGRLGGNVESVMSHVERSGPDPSFAKREAQDLDEKMKARSSKRRKSEPDCGPVGM